MTQALQQPEPASIARWKTGQYSTKAYLAHGLIQISVYYWNGKDRNQPETRGYKWSINGADGRKVYATEAEAKTAALAWVTRQIEPLAGDLAALALVDKETTHEG